MKVEGKNIKVLEGNAPFGLTVVSYSDDESTSYGLAYKSFILPCGPFSTEDEACAFPQDNLFELMLMASCVIASSHEDKFHRDVVPEE